jgi:hypothetical protein
MILCFDVTYPGWKAEIALFSSLRLLFTVERVLNLHKRSDSGDFLPTKRLTNTRNSSSIDAVLLLHSSQAGTVIKSTGLGSGKTHLGGIWSLGVCPSN